MSELPSAIDPRVSELITQLTRCKSAQVEASPAYTFSNDLNVADLIPFIQQQVREIQAPLKVGLVVSHGALFSLGKELPDIDLFIRLDKNTNQTQAERDWSNFLERATSIDQVKRTISDPTQQKHLRREMSSYADYHCLASEEKLRQTQAFLKRRNVAFVTGNVLDELFMTKAGEILRNKKTEIVFADFSNLMEWLQGDRDNKARATVYSRFQLLPFSAGCVCLYSVTSGKAGRSPIIAQVRIGLEQYIQGTIATR